MITRIKGDLLQDPFVDVVCHQVNCQGRMSSGIAKSIREKWPTVYDNYMRWHSECEDKALQNSPPEWPMDASAIMLGKTQVVSIDEEERRVANLAAQEYYGYDGKRYTSYDAFWSCLHDLRAQVSINDIIGFPKGIGCGLGGANWEVIEKMIDEVFAAYYVRIYELEDK